jgi:Tol biopolymer transport system component
MTRLLLIGAAIVCAASACSFGGGESGQTQAEDRREQRREAVLYTIGTSTDPYSNSRPRGFGVALALGTPQQRLIERRGNGLGSFGGAQWIGGSRIAVPQKAPPVRRPRLFRFDGRALRDAGVSPLPVRDVSYAWSPDGRRIASQSVAPCKRKQRGLWACYRQLPAVYVQRADGSTRRRVALGSFNSWAPDGRLLVTDRRASRFWLLDVDSGRRALPLDPAVVARFGRATSVGLGPPRWSADGAYIAAYASGDWPKPTTGGRVSAAIVIATRQGRPLQLVHSPYVISMLAWSPRGHRLAYTTSGFPDPHELFVVDAPAAKPRRIFATARRHFDWVAWSPDAATLLVDDEHTQRWRLLDPRSGRQIANVARLGGKPLWCCPVNAYTTLNS